MADFRPFSPRWGDISFTEAPQTTARCYAGVIFLSYSPSGRHREPAGVEGAARHGAWQRCRWAAAGPGRATSRRVEAPISNPGPTGLEGAGGTRGPGCGARGRWRGLAAAPVGGGRARAGLEIDHSEPQARVWRSRGRAAAHRHTQRPGPQDRKHSGRAAAHGHTEQPGPAGTRVRQRGGYRSTRPLVGSLSHCLVEAQAE